ncbi:oxidoreductase, partial [Francisella tularensis subsp. holarctica]|nr:oxidoreductase [Francisella tularensis subsp. holarctica]
TEGIGKAVIKKLDNSIQADIIISARSLDKIQNIAANLKNTAHVLSCDVADFAEFETVAASALNYKPDFIISFPAFYEP